MNLLMEQKYTYAVFKHIDTINEELISITKTPWYNTSINFAGKVSNENTFKLYSKMSLGIQVLNTYNIAVIAGNIHSEGTERTKINIIVRPHNSVLAAFYILLTFFILQLLDTLTFDKAGWTKSILLFFPLIFIRSLIHFSIGKLKNRFERTMLIKPEEEFTQVFDENAELPSER